MITPKFPEKEKQRQAAVEKYQLLDTLPEEVYDDITFLMAFICETPISLITLMDKQRNFLKSHHGIELSESPRKISFCGHLIYSKDPIMVVEDAREDPRFYDNPLVTEFSAIFYAGVPLIDPEGFRIGTLCVYDNKPRTLTDDQRDALLRMSKQVMSLMVSNYERNQLKLLQKSLSDKYESLSKFAHTVSHDLKSPLNQLIGLVDLITHESDDTLKEPGKSYMKHLKKSAESLKNYIQGLLGYYEKDKLMFEKKEEVVVTRLLDEIIELSKPVKEECKITYESSIDKINVNRSVLMHILINLITNGLKYNDNDTSEILIKIDEDPRHYRFLVKDNGIGIPDSMLESIFELFTVGTSQDKYGGRGSGIGLASVKKFVESNGGEINVSSEEGIGSTFTFTLLK